MIQIYHNSRCSKSRECLAFLADADVEYQIINYLSDIPTIEELKELINKLKIKPLELIRKNEKIWKDNFASKSLSDDELIAAMAQNPILIQRPIVINGDRAVIARPAEKAAAII